VTFDEAKAVLLDPYALTREDKDANNGYPLKVGQIKNNNSQTIKRLIRLL
jgi:hypothetical protein